MRQYNDGEGTIWFRSDAGESMGYWEHVNGDVYAMQDGNAMYVGNRCDINDARAQVQVAYVPEYRKGNSVASSKKADNTVALVGFLAAKLACYEPDSHTVKQALEWLDARTQTR